MSRGLALVVRLEDEAVVFTVFDVQTGKLRYLGSDKCTLDSIDEDQKIRSSDSRPNDAFTFHILCAIDALFLRFDSHFERDVRTIISISIVSDILDTDLTSIRQQQLAAWQSMDAERPLQDYMVPTEGRPMAEQARRTELVITGCRQRSGYRRRAHTNLDPRHEAVRSYWPTFTTTWCTLSSLIRAFLLGKSTTLNVFEAALEGLHLPPSELYEALSVERAEALQAEFVSPYLVARYGVARTCIVAASLPSIIASWISLPASSPSEAMIKFGTRHDEILMPYDGLLSRHAMPDPFSLFGLRQARDESQKILFYGAWKDAGSMRNVFRSKYTKSWKAFKQLIEAVSAGGSVGLDNKLFLFASGHIGNEIKRYERGVEVAHFTDIRANVRCLVEGQALQMRLKCSCAGTDNGSSGGDGLAPDKEGLSRQKLQVDRWFVISEDPGALQFVDVFCQVLGGEACAARESLPHNSEANGHRTTPARSELGGAVLSLYMLCSQKDEDQQIDLRTFAALLLDESERGSIQQLLPFPTLHALRSTNTMLKSTISSRRSLPSISRKGEDESHKLLQPTTLLTMPSTRFATIHSTPSTFASSNSSLSMTSTSPRTSANEEDEGERDKRNFYLFEKVASADEDMWDFYGAMMVEHIRLTALAQE